MIEPILSKTVPYKTPTRNKETTVVIEPIPTHSKEITAMTGSIVSKAVPHSLSKEITAMAQAIRTPPETVQNEA